MTLLLSLMIMGLSFAQGGGFNYKALITDNGQVLATHSVSIRFTVLEDGITSVYQETQSATTDANGIVAVNIGEGTTVSGNFTSIDWGSNLYFLKVEIDTGGGYLDYGTSEFKAVPYAKYAEKADVAEYVNHSFWHQTSNAINSPDRISIGRPVSAEANLHIKDVTGGDALLKMESTDNIYTIWESNRANVDDYLIGIDGGNNRFIFANTTTGDFPLAIKGNRIGVNQLNPTATLDVTGHISMVDGNQAADKVLVSDASGVGSWQMLNNNAAFAGWDKDASDDFSGDYNDLTNQPVTFLKSGGSLPTNINDDMYHSGSIAVGTTVIDANTQVSILQSGSASGVKIGVSTTNSSTNDYDHFGYVSSVNGDGDGYFMGQMNNISGNGSGIHYGVYNNILGAGTGEQYGVYTKVVQSGNANQYGNYAELSGTGSGKHEGIANRLSGNGVGEQYGTDTDIANTGDANHFGNFAKLSGSGSGKHYGVYNKIVGAGTGEQYGTYNFIENSGDANHYGIYSDVRGSGSGDHYGTKNSLSGIGTGTHYGTSNYLNVGGSGDHFGTANTLTGNGSGSQTGTYTNIMNSGNLSHYGTFNSLSGTGSGTHYGYFAQLYGAGTGMQYGVNINIGNTGNQIHYGSSVNLTGSGSGYHYGYYSKLQGNGAGRQYGNFSYLTGTGGGNKYGTWNKILTTAGGTHYAVYGEAEKSGSYAGYFKGDVYASKKLKAPASGDADMKAYIYGSITASGSLRSSASSSGFTIMEESTGVYKITFNDNSIQGTQYLVIATKSDTPYARFVSVQSATGLFRVYIRNLSGDLVDGGFHFVVYKK